MKDEHTKDENTEDDTAKTGKAKNDTAEHDEGIPPMHREPTTAPSDTIQLNSDHLSLRAIGPWLAEVAGRFELTEGDVALDAVELAVHEIAMNIVDHAFRNHPGTFTLTSVCGPESLVVRTADQGERFAPSGYTPPELDEPQVGGYGLFIAEQIADAVRYERVGDENRWELIFKRTSFQL